MPTHTKTQLRTMVATLNSKLGRPPYYSHRDTDDKFVANVGHIVLSMSSPGDGWTRYQLQEVTNTDGGVRLLGPFCNGARECYLVLPLDAGRLGVQPWRVVVT